MMNVQSLLNGRFIENKTESAVKGVWAINEAEMDKNNYHETTKL